MILSPGFTRMEGPAERGGGWGWRHIRHGVQVGEEIGWWEGAGGTAQGIYGMSM